MSRHRLWTDYDARLHVEVDTNAQVLDCFMVGLPPYTASECLCAFRGASMAERWSEALRMVAFFRVQPWKPIHPPHIFQPFGVITARNFDDVQREQQIELLMVEPMMYYADRRWREKVSRDPALHSNPDYYSKLVANLSRAWDLLNGAPVSPPTVPWH